MSNPNYEGKYFSIQGKSLTVFDYTAEPDGKNWYLGGAGTIPRLVGPNPVSEEIIKLIEDDIEAGREDNIDAILISTFYAACLWLEGVITRSHFENAIEETEEEIGFVTLPGVQFLGKEYKVVIIDHRLVDFHALTVDVNGEVV